MISVLMYSIEELREEFLRQFKTKGSIVEVCSKLDISEQAYYKCRNKHMDLPRQVQDRLKISKVVFL